MEYSGALFQKIAATHSLGVIFILQKASFLFPRCSGAHFPFIKHAGRHGEGPPAFEHVPSPWIVKGVTPPCNCDPSLGGCRFRISVCRGCGEPPPHPLPRPSSHRCCVPHCASWQIRRSSSSSLRVLFPWLREHFVIDLRQERERKKTTFRFPNQN